MLGIWLGVALVNISGYQPIAEQTWVQLNPEFYPVQRPVPPIFAAWRGNQFPPLEQRKKNGRWQILFPARLVPPFDLFEGEAQLSKAYLVRLKRINEIKLNNKKNFAAYLEKSTGQVIDPNSIFDCQVKRMHEYKRQHLNALNIAAQYLYLKENPNADFIPKTYIFGAKAAPGYYMAKQMIRMICKLGDLINNDPAVRDKLRVVYLEEYCVSLSEHLMPAAEVSEQISLAGTEASGTGNMKFMLNGAITLGTLDGANVEIADAAGKENELIFGMLTPEVNNLKRVGYHPNAFIMGDDVANSALNFLERGWNGENFHEVTENLRTSDPYMVMADFKDYRRAQADLQKLYADRETWARMSLKNIANSGIFSADRAVLDYARDIWYASPVPMGK